MYILAIKLLALAALTITPTIGLAKDVDRTGADALMAECQQQRAENIAPLKEQAIEDCVTRNLKDREACERHNQNFGERTHGGRQPGLFWNLPVCTDAVAAERYFRMNPGRNSFTLP